MAADVARTDTGARLRILPSATGAADAVGAARPSSWGSGFAVPTQQQHPMPAPAQTWQYHPSATTRRHPSRLPWLIGAIVILVVAGVVVVVVGSHHTTSAGKGAATTTSGPSSPNAPAPPTDPVAVAQTIGLQAKDLAGYAFKPLSKGVVQTTHSVPGPCTPVSSQPWWALVSSDIYIANPNSAVSQTALLPSATDVHTGLAAVTAPQYGTACIKPQNDASLAKGTTSCPSPSINSTVAALTAGSAWPGATGWRYVATVSCSGQQQQLTADTLFRGVGNVLIEGKFVLFSGPQPGLEQSVMNAMAARARWYLSGH